ncbi:hypothetical protein GII33_18955 [Gordonia pseudamarae]|uniref:ABC transporter permease n=1 Tax=Gordonia pseudamarae TaxID=2831662 RepID=A0ABX6IN72_9ACTN|nr:MULTISPECIES: hypothetical protein [Gordonia]MBD0020708.1 hypothetical protein [Gordonia sp. (in: high G+C Gram-positive bacteria)]QHN27746.1 hypothetical protein GII33_18955 [Gordonia pseudamarae]QHN36628.1 hypothetical protein GII31_18730 [Gordonia pseudamarae]
MWGLRNAIRAELTKLTWRSGTLWAAVPLSIIIPVLVTGVIAAGNQMIADTNREAGPDAVQLPGGYSMTPDNSVYWVLFFATFIMMCAAVNSYGTEIKNKTVDLFGFIQPARWTQVVAKLVVFGTIGALSTAAGVVFINGVFPHLFPGSWSDVGLFTGEGVRFLWSIPLYTLLLIAAGLGMVAIVRHTYIVVAFMLFVKLGTEAFLAFADIDLAERVRRYSPFVNAEYSTGQMQGMPDGIWGENIAIGYYAVIFLAVFAVGVWRSAQVSRN